MKKFLRALAVAVCGVFLLAGAASAESTVQQILDNMTVSPIAGVSSVNVATDTLLDGTDSYWGITATGGSVATLVIEIAGLAGSNTFGVFNGINNVELFDGSATAGAQVTLSIDASGNVFVNHSPVGVNFAGRTFGYYLGTTGGTFYSDTSLNADMYDHMWALQGKGDFVNMPSWGVGQWTDSEYVLAFEDTYGGGDQDHNDMIVMVESVRPVPEPATMFLLGLGLLGIGITKRRKS